MTDTHKYSPEMMQYMADRAAREAARQRTWHYRLLFDLIPWWWDHTPRPIRFVLVAIGFAVMAMGGDLYN